jgi:hypothetical protein
MFCPPFLFICTVLLYEICKDFNLDLAVKSGMPVAFQLLNAWTPNGWLSCLESGSECQIRRKCIENNQNDPFALNSKNQYRYNSIIKKLLHIFCNLSV